MQWISNCSLSKSFFRSKSLSFAKTKKSTIWIRAFLFRSKSVSLPEWNQNRNEKQKKMYIHCVNVELWVQDPPFPFGRSPKIHSKPSHLRFPIRVHESVIASLLSLDLLIDCLNISSKLVLTISQSHDITPPEKYSFRNEINGNVFIFGLLNSEYKCSFSLKTQINHNEIENTCDD